MLKHLQPSSRLKQLRTPYVLMDSAAARLKEQIVTTRCSENQVHVWSIRSSRLMDRSQAACCLSPICTLVGAEGFNGRLGESRRHRQLDRDEHATRLYCSLPIVCAVQSGMPYVYSSAARLMQSPGARFGGFCLLFLSSLSSSSPSA